MKDSLMFNFLSIRLAKNSSHNDHRNTTPQQSASNTDDANIANPMEPVNSEPDINVEKLIEFVNLEVADREKSVEYVTLSKIIPVSAKITLTDTSYVNESDEEDAEEQLDPQPSITELVQDPFSDIESENAHAALFKFLFEPIDPASQDGDSSDLNLSDEVIGDLEDLKDRIQYRYNVLKRNLFNIKSHE